MGHNFCIVLIGQRTALRSSDIYKKIHKILIHPISKLLITEHHFVHTMARNSPIGKTMKKNQFLLLFCFL